MRIIVGTYSELERLDEPNRLIHGSANREIVDRDLPFFNDSQNVHQSKTNKKIKQIS
jgi:hypothetical protein